MAGFLLMYIQVS